ncbi:putative heterokaryon incompatibility protein [Botrytis fragariae]|uniref:Putative heterokaryon incompatibility protein n=1 Tax=Botrytis fragariae TaxID=1964551 RepID=A0A8H6AQ36_9HELO|nr:putative heterokaryon incompatibility protein [Botrytis fragariae]KAF5871584.1 putative heterokaryon incompatibility protein [Botrytis fragariae]
MCFVYNNAKFNIAAAAARDGDSGFLPERLSVKLGHFLRSEIKTIARTLWIRSSLQIGHATGEVGISLSCPLFGRAWVLQESILAARTLIYSPVGVHFRCRMSKRSDEDPAKDAGDLDIFVENLPLSCYSYPDSEDTDILWDAMFVGAHIDFVSNHYGPVKVGSITFKGHLLKIDIACFVSPFRENIAVYNGLALGTFYADAKLDLRKKYWVHLLEYERRKITVKSWSSAKEFTLVLLKQRDGMERRICLGLILMGFGCGSFKRDAYFQKFDALWPPKTRDVVI